MEKEGVGKFGKPFPTAVEMRNVTGLVYDGPCVLHSASISGDGANADCDLYDGLSTTGRRRLHLEVLSGTSFDKHFRHGAIVDQGLYLVVNAATTFVTVEYTPIEK